jgi:hypothetical protein
LKVKLQRPREEETNTSGVEIEAKLVESEATETTRGGNRNIRARK